MVGAPLAFSDFIKQVENGGVSKVDIKGDELTGQLKDGSKFHTNLPEYPELVDKLRENNVGINVLPLVSKSEKIIARFLSFLPFILMS